MIICHKHNTVYNIVYISFSLKGGSGIFCNCYFFLLGSIDREYILLCFRLKTIETNLKNPRSEGTSWLLDNLKMVSQKNI